MNDNFNIKKEIEKINKIFDNLNAKELHEQLVECGLGKISDYKDSGWILSYKLKDNTMKVKDKVIIKFTPEKNSLSGKFEEILEKLDLSIVHTIEGKNNNKSCDGEYHKHFIVSSSDYLFYVIEIYSNLYKDEAEKLDDILNSEMITL